MNENSKDIIAVVAKRTMTELKDEFTEFFHISPLYIALALYGALAVPFYALFSTVILYSAWIAYMKYKQVDAEIAFDIESAKYYSDKAKEANKASSTVTPVTPEPAEPVQESETANPAETAEQDKK